MANNLYVLALLKRNNGILMVQRHNVAFDNGFYSLIGGKVEPNERIKHAIHREVLEETSLDIPEDDFTLVHTLHRNGSECPFIALCFMADISNLPAPHNSEPSKHNFMTFFTSNELPHNLLPAHKQIIECIERKSNYSEHGW